MEDLGACDFKIVALLLALDHTFPLFFELEVVSLQTLRRDLFERLEE